MKNLIVKVPSIAAPIQESPGFEKKGLSEYKLDLCGLCGFGCRYCSSNSGNYLRTRKKPFAELAREQIGSPLTPQDDPSLMYAWPDVLLKLEAQLDKHDQSWGDGKTIVFSMLTDGFSPELVKNGTTRRALEMVIDGTSFRIRVLTKNAIVGSDRWIEFFAAHADRFVVGLSCGTQDDAWAKKVEIGTSLPSARLKAIRRLQDAGVPTYGMLCPVFPDLLESDSLEQLVDAIQPSLVEHVWAEPYNDRQNWEVVRDGYERGSSAYRWLTETFGDRRRDLWSRYATDLYARLRDKARAEGWLGKLRYLLYEDQITEADADAFRGLDGVWLQSKPGSDGRSQNPHIAALQMECPTTTVAVDSYSGFEHHQLGDQCTFHTGTLPADLRLTDAGFEELWKLHPDVYPKIKMFGREVETPRWQQAYGKTYHFSGKDYQALPLPPSLVPLLTWCRDNIDGRLNGLLLNWYDAEHEHYIGKHRDSTTNLVEGAPIVTISLGAERTFRLRPWKDSGMKDFPACDGTVFVMPYETNLAWTHEVPHFQRDSGRRISVTARAFRD